jgi:two-component system, cell cycle sensor histidine kinase and response regulator CckA
MGASKINNELGASSPGIFVVDDEPILLELAEQILSNIQADVRTFSNPEIALKTYTDAEKRPDLIITDFAMHEMDGLALIRACRRLNPNQKILLISGTVDEAAFNGTGLKPDGFLAKPYQPAALTNVVQKLLNS